MAKPDPKDKGKAFRDSLKQSKYQSEFVRYNLTEDERAAVKKWGFDPEMFATALIRLIDQKYKVTFRFDDASNAYACWILAPAEGTDNDNLILSGRGSSPVKAFKQAYWQHEILFDCRWPSRSAPQSPDDIDD